MAQSPVTQRRSTWILVIVALGVFVAADDQTSVVTVLPSIIRDTGITVDDFYRSSWVLNGYLLGYLAAMPLLGRVADVFGRGRVFVATLGVFIVGSALVAMAPNFNWLIVARAVQAVGAGGVVPVAMAIVVDEVPPARRAIGLGAIAAASEAGALLGPAWGGVIADLAGWRWVFWINVPMTLPILVAGYFITQSSERRPGRIDWAGAALLAAALSVLTVAFVDDPVTPRPVVITVALILVAAALGAAFVRHEARADGAMVRLSMFAPRAFWVANLVHVLVGGGLIVALMGVPLFVNLLLGGTPLDGGWTLMRLTAPVPLGALAGGWLASRVGLRGTATAGLLLTVLCFAGLGTWDTNISEVMRTVPLALGGFGFGLVIAPLGLAVFQHVSEDERATAAAWLTMSRVIGMLIGAALLTSQGLGRFYARAGAVEFNSPDFLDIIAEAQSTTFREVFLAAAVVMAVATVLAWFLGRGRAEADEKWWTLG